MARSRSLLSSCTSAVGLYPTMGEPQNALLITKKSPPRPRSSAFRLEGRFTVVLTRW